MCPLRNTGLYRLYSIVSTELVNVKPGKSEVATHTERERDRETERETARARAREREQASTNVVVHINSC